MHRPRPRGKGPGAIGPTGVREKDQTLLLGHFLREKLQLHGHEVTMTRYTDVDVNLASRARLANREEADCFLSLHFNGAENPSANGAEVWHYPGSAKGEALAGELQRCMVGFGQFDRGIKASSRLAVLRLTRMPAVLVEPAFITNPDEERLLQDLGWLNELAGAIARGLEQFSERRGDG
ncbi:MAG: N-acetylmuramoyl-L-alanine amidase [Pigmentiphaga sp.]